MTAIPEQPDQIAAEEIPFFKSIRFRMALAILLLAVLPLALVSTASYIQGRRLLRQQVSNQMEAAAQIASQQIHADMQTRYLRLKNIFERGSLRSNIINNFSIPSKHAETRTALLEALTTKNVNDNQPIFQDIAIIAPNGLVRFASQEEWENLYLGDILSELTSLNEGTYLFTDFAPLYPNQITLATFHKVYDNQGNLKFLAIGFSRSQAVVNLLLGTRQFHPEASAYFINHNNQFIGIDPHTFEISVFQPAEKQADLSEVIPSLTDQGKLFENVNRDTTPVVAYMQPQPDLNAALVIQLPREVVYQQINALVPFMLLLSAAALLIVIGLSFVGTTQLTRPLLNLAETQQDFAAGNLDRRIVTNRDDELGILQRTFNHLADELQALYQSMEKKVRERTEQIRAAAEVAQTLNTTKSIDALLQKTVTLIVERFGYYHAGIFLLDPTGKTARLQAANGPVAEIMLEQAHELKVGSDSIVGWVSSHNEPRIASDVSQDAVHWRNPLLPETRAEAGIPIAMGSAVFGVLDVQSTNAHAFDQDAIATLHILASEVASAIYNHQVRQAQDLNLGLVDSINRASYRIITAENEETIQNDVRMAMREFDYPSIWLRLKTARPNVIHSWDPLRNRPLDIRLPETCKISLDSLETLLGGSAIDVSLQSGKANVLPDALLDIARQLGTQHAIIIPVYRNEQLQEIILAGSNQPATPQILRTYNALGIAISSARTNIYQQETVIRRLHENDAIIALSGLLTSASTLDELFAALHQSVRQTLGDYAFLIAFYHAETSSISIPYLYENQQVTSLESFPLGEGLTSVVLRTRQPLRLVEDTENQAQALGAKIVGSAAKSWLGVPLLVNDQPVGVMVVQDIEHENAFDENDERFLTALANQAAGLIQKIRLLNETHHRAIQVQTAAEIARDISQSIHLDDLLQKAVELIRERLNFYHAAIFLIEGDYAVIREGTGEVGLKMKRMGHKLAVGSKSTVGYASQRGEVLVINNTIKDATHKPNPLLPDTRAEAAIPLQVSERVIGVLDVQSTEPYAFNEDNLRTLQVLADQLAIAIQNTELFSRMQENLSQQRLLHNITAQAAIGTSIEDALDTAVQGMQVTLGGDRIAIMLLDAQRQTLRVAAARGYSEREISQMVIPVGRGITGWAAANKRTVRVDDTTQDPRYVEMEGILSRSELAIPLIYRNEILGVLNVESEVPNAYNAETVEMLETMASNLAAIIANARLIERIRHQVNRERMLFEASSRIRRSTSVENILRITAQELARALNARRAEIKIKPQTRQDKTGE